MYLLHHEPWGQGPALDWIMGKMNDEDGGGGGGGGGGVSGGDGSGSSSSDGGGSGSSKQMFLIDYRDSGTWFRKQQ